MKGLGFKGVRWWLLAGTGALSLFSASLGSADHPGLRIEPAIVGGDLFNPVTKTLKRGRRDRNLVCLTIDDGPYGRTFPYILKILEKYEAKATFFMVGKRISERPDLVRRALDEGHEIGNHTQDHRRLSELSPDEVRKELRRCEEQFASATGGGRLTYFRPPGLRMNSSIQAIAREFGYVTVLANYGGKDFRRDELGPTVAHEEDIEKYVLDNVTPGGIILLHDVPETVRILPNILKGLRQRGLKIVTVSEMLADVEAVAP